MIRLKLFFVAILASSIATLSVAQDNPFNSGQKNFPDWSPFMGVRWEDDSPFVQIIGNKEWYKIQTFHGLPIDAILAHCNSEGWDPKRRFTQDPVQVIRLMGHKIDKSTTLQLKDTSGKISTFKNVKMTAEARKRCVFPFNRLLPDYPAWSPFVAVKWEGNKPYVRLNGINQWYELEAIHGIPIGHLSKICKENNWDLKKRVTEDTAQLIRLVGQEIDKTTSLELCDESGKKVKRKDVKMTSENLRRILSRSSM